VLIRGASVIDGSGADPVRADVRVEGATVAEMAPSLNPQEGEEVVDAGGLTLTPGFVDLHSHSDLYTLVRRGVEAPVGDGPKLLQGCTAQVFGQDGISAAPVGDDDVEGYAAYIAGLDGFLEPSRWTWRTFGDYLGGLRSSSSTRTAGLVGHSTVRRLVMGMEARLPTPDELGRMQVEVARALDDGALGLSTGLVYAPASFCETAELVALCQVVAERGGRFFVHVRSESDRVLEATKEVCDVARATGVHLHYSHIKTAGRANWSKAPRLAEMVDELAADGFSVTSDLHPYTAGSTTATVLLPPWALEGGRDAALARLADPAARARMREQLLHDTTSWDNWWAFSDGWDGLHVAAASDPSVVGRSFPELLAEAGVTDPHGQEAFDVAFDLLRREGLAVSIISFNNTEDTIARFLGEPHCSIGSDALVNPDGHPHPRLYGTFPRVLGRYVRERSVLSLPQAVHAMTARAWTTIGFDGRGLVRPGAAADLVLVDPETVLDRATYAEPRLHPEGISRVWVAGRPVVSDAALLADVPPAG
jgi:N-acyl-D-amino-acid deacylase